MFLNVDKIISPPPTNKPLTLAMFENTIIKTTVSPKGKEKVPKAPFNIGAIPLLSIGFNLFISICGIPNKETAKNVIITTQMKNSDQRPKIQCLTLNTI